MPTERKRTSAKAPRAKKPKPNPKRSEDVTSDPPGELGTADSDFRPPTGGVIRASQLATYEHEWLVPGWIPRGCVTVLGGPSGVGKSTFLAGLVAQCTGGPKLLHACERMRSGALWFTAEEQPGGMVTPRLLAADADLAMVGYPGWDQNGRLIHRLQLPQDLELLRTTIHAERVALCVMDPITSYLGMSCDPMSARDVRGLLEVLEMVASDTGAAIVLTLHDRKSGQGGSMDQYAGSAAWTQTPRIIVRLGHDPDVTGRCVMTSDKCSLARKPKSRYYTLSETGGPPRFELGEECELTSEDLGRIETSGGERDCARRRQKLPECRTGHPGPADKGPDTTCSRERPFVGHGSPCQRDFAGNYAPNPLRRNTLRRLACSRGRIPLAVIHHYVLTYIGEHVVPIFPFPTPYLFSPSLAILTLRPRFRTRIAAFPYSIGGICPCSFS